MLASNKLSAGSLRPGPACGPLENFQFRPRNSHSVQRQVRIERNQSDQHAAGHQFAQRAEQPAQQGCAGDFHAVAVQPAFPGFAQVSPAKRSQAAAAKAATKTTTDGLPAHSYQSLLAHLGTLTRNNLQYGPHGPVVPTLAEPTNIQRRAFELLGVTVPLTSGT